MSGGLAVAEALGRFGQLGVRSAFYWTYPPKASPAYWAFLAYRNFDGKGGRFLDASLPTNAEKDTSLFASIDASGTHMVIVALNFMPDRPMRPKIVLDGCKKATSQNVYEFAGDATGFVAKPSKVAGGEVDLTAAPYSITVVDVHLSP